METRNRFFYPDYSQLFNHFNQLPTRTILAWTIITSLLPFLMLTLFPTHFHHVMDRTSYLLFHNVSEFFSIMVSLSIFGVGWNTYNYSKDRRALFLSAAFLTIGLLDFMHALGNAAMPAFITPNSSNKSTQFWIAARLFSALAFLLSAFVYSERQPGWLLKAILSPSVLITAALAIPLFVFTGIIFFPSYVPDTFIPGVGLTPFKVYSEHLTICLFCIAGAIYWRRMARTGDRLFIYYVAAFIICICSELVFAGYKSVFDTYNVLGHIYKVVAFYLIYKGIFIASVRNPYAELYKTNERLDGEIAERKQAQETLRYTSDRLRSFVDANIVGVVIASPSGGVIEANDYYLSLIGFTREEFEQGMVDWRIITPSEWLFADEHAIEELRESGICTPYEKEYVRRDGTRVSVFLSDAMLPGPDEQIAAFVLDITERKRMEEALLKSEEQYRQLFEASPVAISVVEFICDAEGRPNDYRFLHVNPAYERFVQAKAADIVGRTVFEFAPQADPAIVERFGRVALTGVSDQFEGFNLRLNRHFEATLYSPRHGQCVTYILDVTDRKRVEKELRDSEEKYKLIAENADDWVYWVSPDGNVRYTSPSCERVTGYSMADFFNNPQLPIEMTHPEDREIIIHHSEKIREEEEIDHLEYRIITKTGEKRWISHICSPIYNEDGLYVGRRGTNRNITDRKRAEEELRKHQDHLEELVKERTEELAEANLHLQELDRLKSMFIASMSHELRTPLNSIIGFTGIILMGMSGEISAVQKKQLGMVKNSANHLLELINDVIDVSKIETGKTDLSIDAFDLSDLALEVKESFAIAAADKGLELECRTDGGAEVTSDRRRVRQILVNLVGNAIKFTETGMVLISVSKTGKGVEIKVSDTGIGLYREDMERLFLAFSRIYMQGRPIVEGTGLGLYLSRRVAALLRGEITAESEPGRGSEFTFSLPWKYPGGKE